MSSQLFTREMIEELTCPPEEGDEEVEDNSKNRGENRTIVKPTLQIHTQLVQ